MVLKFLCLFSIAFNSYATVKTGELPYLVGLFGSMILLQTLCNESLLKEIKEKLNEKS